MAYLTAINFTFTPKPRAKFYRKIGGLHFVALGRFRVSFCKVKA